MVHFLYKDFLEDKRVYNLNIGYWQRLFKKLLQKRIDLSANWMKTQFANGKSFYDGNPIFTVLVSNSQKGVRIIQEVPETEDMEIGAWTGTVSINDKVVPELVITLELSRESKKVAEDLISKWVIEDYDPSRMEQYISKSLKN